MIVYLIDGTYEPRKTLRLTPALLFRHFYRVKGFASRGSNQKSPTSH